jgi:hypothetical protein
MITPRYAISCARRFEGHLLVVLCGRDPTALGFSEQVIATRDWEQIARSKAIALRVLPEADHTFARAEWREKIADWTLEWQGSW